MIDICMAELGLVFEGDDNGGDGVEGDDDKVGNEGHLEGHKFKHLYYAYDQDHCQNISKYPVLARKPPSNYNWNADQHSHNIQDANFHLPKKGYPCLYACYLQEVECLDGDDGD